jgi:ribonuclease HII
MTYPNFLFENRLRKLGYKFIAGVDEVGRGSFAGPVVAGCVVFPCNGVLPLARAGPAGSSSRPTFPAFAAGARRDSLRFRHPSESIIINDSKKLSPKQRELADKWIRKNALAWGIGSAGVAQINRLGIKKASEVAFRRAIVNCKLLIDYLLIDAFYIPYVRGLRRKNQKPIVKGDTKSVSIAAASIIAKVYRDKLMVGLGKKPKYRKYKWLKNKGYGTLEHRKAIEKYGLTRQHRKTFVATWINNSSSSPAR